MKYQLNKGATIKKELISTKSLADKVEYCLYHFPNARNEDAILLYTVANEFYPNIFKENEDMLKAFNTLPKPTQIARARREVIKKHKNKKYLPSEWSIAKKRGYTPNEWKKFMMPRMEDPQYEDTDGMPVTSTDTVLVKLDSGKKVIVPKQVAQDMQEIENMFGDKDGI